MVDHFIYLSEPLAISAGEHGRSSGLLPKAGDEPSRARDRKMRVAAIEMTGKEESVEMWHCPIRVRCAYGCAAT